MPFTSRRVTAAQIPSRGRLIALLYLPWIFAECLAFNPVASYFCSWMGSFLIFYLSILSSSSYHGLDRPIMHQILRPFILMQLIFAGFMCCTSIFYFVDHLGYKYSTSSSLLDFIPGEKIELIAECQRLTLLAHASLVTGILLQTKTTIHSDYILKPSNRLFPLKLCVMSYLAGMLISYIPGILQFQYMLISLSMSLCIYIFVKGVVIKEPGYIIFGGGIFIINLMDATLSGYKERIIVTIILLGFMTFPYYKKTILFLCIPCTYLMLYALPTFTTIIRVQSWQLGKSREAAREQAYETLLNEQNEQKIIENNWEFLTNRFSETGMFTTYLKVVPEQHPYYGLDILMNSFYALIPRILWEEKPDTEKLAMERVYKSGVAHRSSNVSAKTRPIIDAYLSGGVFGVFIYMLVYGMLAQSLCNTAERLFGGYQFGCVIIFNSIFQPLWRGNSLEFLLNNIVYGYILMLILHKILIQVKSLQPVEEDHTHHTIL